MIVGTGHFSKMLFNFYAFLSSSFMQLYHMHVNFDTAYYYHWPLLKKIAMGHELPYLISRNELDCIVDVSAHPRKLHRSTIREIFPLYDIARSLAQGLGSGNETITVSDTGTSSPIRACTCTCSYMYVCTSTPS